MTARLAVARGVVDLWQEPRRGPDDERLTQALLGCPAVVEEERGTWCRVRLPDYTGWLERAALAPVATPRADVLVVEALEAPLYATPDATAPLDVAYLGTVLPLLGRDGERWRVALPGARTAWVASAAGRAAPAARPFEVGSGAAAVAVARRLLGAPYLWGGGTVAGIDCSALVQLAWRLCGQTLPRDADQQWAALRVAVGCDALAPGDLLFFARAGAVVHVAMALGGRRLIHALGEPPRGVCIESLDPAAPDFNLRLATLYLGARRVVGCSEPKALDGEEG